jgi:hypothetical protein
VSTEGFNELTGPFVKHAQPLVFDDFAITRYQDKPFNTFVSPGRSAKRRW